MKQSELVLKVIDALTEEGVPHMIAGSMAAMPYSMPRSTKDVDFVLETTQPAFDRVLKRLEEWFIVDPQQHLETLTWTRRYILQARSGPFKVELFIKDEDAHHLEQWKRRSMRFNSVLQREVTTPTAEDVIIQKVRWGRIQDRADVYNVIGTRGDTLDWPYIEKWCDEHNTRKALEEIRAMIPPV